MTRPRVAAGATHVHWVLLIVLGLIGLGAVLTLGGCGGRQSGVRVRTAPEADGLETFVATRFDADGDAYPEVQVSIPYSRLVFQQRDDTLAAGVTVLVVAARGDDRVGGGVGRAETRVDSFAETRQSTPLVCNTPVRVRGEGPVDLLVTVEVNDTSRTWRMQLAYDAGVAGSVPVYFTALHWNLVQHDLAGACFGIDSDTMQVEVSLALRPGDNAWPAQGMSLVWRVTNEQRDDDLVRRRRISRDDLATQELRLRVDWPARRLPFGRSDLVVELAVGEGEAARTMPCGPPRSLINLQLPWWDDKQWRLHCEWLDGRLGATEIGQLKDLPRNQRRQAWRAFWQRVADIEERSASAAQREHLLRVVEADRRFGVFSRGAASDRGRVYVRYGHPDRSERFGDEFVREGIWEVWYYHEIGLRFTFFDSHGLGDFRLHETSGY